MLETPPAENAAIFMALFGALHFSKKQFPQAFHSKIGLATLRKLFKKDLFSGQNRCFFDARGGVTLVQTDRPSVKWPAVRATVAPEGKRALSKTPKRRVPLFPQCETAKVSTKRWDKPQAQARQAANRGRTRCTTG
jgi:hypothetical protein